MVKFLTILLPFFMMLPFAKKSPTATGYYFSNAGNDVTGDGTIGNPWATITKLNSVWAAGTFAPGDFILLRRGDVFSGTITPSESGTAGNPITISAYGSGADPVISGLTTVTAWTSLGSNIYESTSAITASTTFRLYMVTLNGVPQAMGRYPNITEPDKGYLNIDSHTGTTQITENAIPSSTTNWTGARAVVRVKRWFHDTLTVTAHSGNTITLRAGTTYTVTDGFGFFLTNDSRTLDQHGEWYYNPTTRKVRMYLTTAPANYTIKVSTVDNLVDCTNDQYITMDNITIEGANNVAINIGGSARDFTFQNGAVNFTGSKVVDCNNSVQVNLKFLSNSINYSLNYAFDLRTAGNSKTVQYNTIRNIAPFAGYASGTQSAAVIVSDAGNSHVFSDNDIDSIGYLGIYFSGTGTQVKRNHIRNFCMMVDDGAGIYAFGGTTELNAVAATGSEVMYNTVHHGLGVPEGSTGTVGNAEGIYMDDNSSGVSIKYNNCFSNANRGIYLHNAFNHDIQYNTLYDNGTFGMRAAHDLAEDHIISGITFKHNIIVAKTAAQQCLNLYNSLNTTQDPESNSINNFGTVDSNYYARPFDDNLVIQARQFGAASVNYTIPTWRAAYNHDDHTSGSPVTFSDPDSTDYYIVFLYNPTGSAVTEDLINGASYTTVDGDDYAESALVPAYGSLLLLRTPDPPDPPAPGPKKVLRRGDKILKRGDKILIN